jgi:short-subunit dehydrogenase
MTWVVIGASAGLGRALSEELARDGRSLLLVASDRRDLDALAADLRVRFRGNVRALECDVTATGQTAEAVAQALADAPIEGLLFPVGAVAENDNGLLRASAADELLRIHLTSVMSIVGRLLPRMLEQRRGVIVGFGSVAAVRGRRRNVVYSAAKRALESYFESLRNLCEPHGVTLMLYVVGFMDTNQAFGQKLRLPRAQPTQLARRIGRELGRRSGKRYLPRWWRPVSLALRVIPWPVFRRLRF